LSLALVPKFAHLRHSLPPLGRSGSLLEEMKAAVDTILGVSGESEQTKRPSRPQTLCKTFLTISTFYTTSTEYQPAHFLSKIVGQHLRFHDIFLRLSQFTAKFGSCRWRTVLQQIYLALRKC